jgi:hypothetical protein
MEDPELAHFFNREMIEQYRGFGGVRIEVHIVSTFHGYRTCHSPWANPLSAHFLQANTTFSILSFCAMRFTGGCPHHGEWLRDLE